MILRLNQPPLSVRQIAAGLAARYGVSSVATAVDRLAQVDDECSGELGTRDVTRDTLLALRRANVIDAERHAQLLLTHLREVRAAG